MQQVAARMQPFFSENRMNLLVQGSGAPRGRLLEQFKTTARSVLFGTDSFWMGVDVPGEALSNVIITRLPFAVPDHPLTPYAVAGAMHTYRLEVASNVGALLIDGTVVAKRRSKSSPSAIGQRPPGPCVQVRKQYG